MEDELSASKIVLLFPTTELFLDKADFIDSTSAILMALFSKTISGSCSKINISSVPSASTEEISVIEGSIMGCSILSCSDICPEEPVSRL